MRQVVAYKRLITIENHLPSGPKSGRGRLQEVFTRGFNCKALTGKILVIWIGGRLWQVVAYEKWSHMEV